MSELTWINFFFKVLLTSPAPVNTLNITYTCVNFVFHEIVIINKCYVINVINVINKCYVSKKIQETNIGFSNWSFFLVFFFLSVSPVFIIFHFHLWQSLEEQSGRRHVLMRRQISAKLLLCHHDEIKIRGHIEFSEESFNLELSSHSIHL